MVWPNLAVQRGVGMSLLQPPTGSLKIWKWRMEALLPLLPSLSPPTLHPPAKLPTYRESCWPEFERSCFILINTIQVLQKIQTVLQAF